jgi:hypothetical protein
MALLGFVVFFGLACAVALWVLSLLGMQLFP